MTLTELPINHPSPSPLADPTNPKIKIPRKRFVGSSGKLIRQLDQSAENPPTAMTSVVHLGRSKQRLPLKNKSSIPDALLTDPLLCASIKANLPSNYNFEIYKTIHQIKQNRKKRVALQFPEGLQIYACSISDILEQFTGVETVIMGDVTYGACCVDDYTAIALECDFLVHYGHSCLVPMDVTSIQTLYVFVDIQIDIDHLVAMVETNIDSSKHIALLATIQFVSSLHQIKSRISSQFTKISIPQCKPLSPGEILGCTSPHLSKDIDLIIYVGDGKFHLESILIQNPEIIQTYRYDPYAMVMTIEAYDHMDMRNSRLLAIQQAQSAMAQTWGIILGSLGRQGSPQILNWICSQCTLHNIKFIVVCMSEILPTRLDLFGKEIQCWVQIACPRLSIDWGRFFSVPLLNPYEAAIVFNATSWNITDEYRMDYYKRKEDVPGPWCVNWHK